MSSLPQELIDKIIDEVSQTGSTHDLRACCLVQKRWVERSRRHLFKEVSLCTADQIWDWVKLVPPGRDEPYHHVRSLTYRQSMGTLGPRQLLDLFPGHFTSFTGLESLRIDDLSLVWFTSTSMQKAFSPVGRFIRTLVAKDVVLTLNRLLMFLTYFPRLETLRLMGDLMMFPEDKERPQSLPRLVGELVLICRQSAHSAFVLELSKLPLRYSKLDITFVWNSEIPNAVGHLILTCSPTLEKLTLRNAQTHFYDSMFGVSNSNHSFTHDCWTGPPAEVNGALPPDLKRCSLLREVAVQVPNYKAQEHLVPILGTIRSHKLETIEFMGPADDVRWSVWATVDNDLCALVDRLEEDGWKEKLQVLLHYSESEGDPFEEGQPLTRFRSKESGEVVESVGNCSAYWGRCECMSVHQEDCSYSQVL